MPETFFKQCKICLSRWASREDFISDPDVVLIGYQANFVEVEKGVFLFNHSCGGTMSISVLNFAVLYNGPIYRERKTGTESCPGYCLHRNVFKPCPAKCECAYVLKILELLRNRQVQDFSPESLRESG